MYSPQFCVPERKADRTVRNMHAVGVGSAMEKCLETQMGCNVY